MRIPADAELTARVLAHPRAGQLADRPLAIQELPCELRDISVGGVGLPSGQERRAGKGLHRGPPAHRTVHDLRQDPDRRPHAPPRRAERRPTVRAGVQFKALENNLDGRQTLAQLTRIVGELQREEVRRLRLGLCKAG